MNFIDESRIFVKSGNGGDGCVSFFRSKFANRGKPDGGNGGRGGDVIFYVDKNLNTLFKFQLNKHYRAEDGFNGQSKNKTGRSGKTLYISVPLGTQIYNWDGSFMVYDLDTEDSTYILQRGGNRGLGNSHFKSSVNQTPYKVTKGIITDEVTVLLKLKTLSDVGIVGLPNSGKSSLISKITAKKPLIAEYPFSTLHPQLGVVCVRGRSYTISDIPGLIKDSHLGVGLGFKFLKHVERCSILLHLIDISSDNILEDYLTIRRELECYSDELCNKTEIICFNKIELLSKKQVQAKLDLLQQFLLSKEVPKSKQEQIFLISIHRAYGLNFLARNILYILKNS